MNRENIITAIEQNKETIAVCLERGESVELSLSRHGKLKAFRKRAYHMTLAGRQKGGNDEEK